MLESRRFTGVPPDLDSSIATRSNHLSLFNWMMLGPQNDAAVHFWRRIGRQHGRLRCMSQSNGCPVSSTTYIEEIPCPHCATFVPAHNTSFVVPKARTTSVALRGVTGEVVQELPGGRVHQADVRIQRGGQIGLVVLCGHHGSHGV